MAKRLADFKPGAQSRQYPRRRRPDAGPQPGASNLSVLEARGVGLHGRGPFTLRVGEGRRLALSGPSGSGKSLLLRAIADLEPHQGQISWKGVEAKVIPPARWRRLVGLLPSESGWWAPRVIDHFPPAWDLADQLPRLAFSPEAGGWEIDRLSSGERQRLALLRLLANTPEVLLLDEPTANLDPDATARVEALVVDYQVRTRCPVIWVSHDPAQIKRIADQHMVLGRPA